MAKTIEEMEREHGKLARKYETAIGLRKYLDDVRATVPGGASEAELDSFEAEVLSMAISPEVLYEAAPKSTDGKVTSPPPAKPL